MVSLQVTLRKPSMINATDLYPYGAPALSSTREFSLKQNKLLNGKETQDELGYNVVDLGQRDIDPFVPMFPTIDRFAEKYHWMSPYQYAAGDPVKYIDNNGDSIILSKDFLNNKTLVSAFKQFAGTKEGKAFLGKYAAEGQEILGVKFDKAGDLNGKGMDISYGAKDLGESTKGETDTSEKENGRVGIDITMNTNDNIKDEKGNTWSGNHLLFEKTKTIFHESFIHGDLFTKDYLDDKQFNYSNISSAAKKDAGGFYFSSHYQHSAVRLGYLKNGYNNMWPGAAYRGLNTVNQRLKTGYTAQQIVDKMWNFSGANP